MSEETTTASAPEAQGAQAPATDARSERMRAAFDDGIKRERASQAATTPDGSSFLPTKDEAKPEAAKPEKPAPKPQEPAEAPEGEGGDQDTANPYEGLTRDEERRYERARQAMKRSGFEDDELDAMDPKAVIRRGEQRQETLREADRAFSRSAKSEAKDESPTPEEPRQADHPRNGGDTALQPVAESLGLDGAEARQFQDAISNEVQRRTQAAIDAALEPLRAQLERSAMDNLRERYRDSIPDLRDWAKVQARATKLVKTGDYDSVPDAIEDAATLVLGHRPGSAAEPKADGSQDRDSEGRFASKQRRSNGTPPGSRRAPAPTKPKTQAEIRRAAYDASLRGDAEAYFKLTGKVMKGAGR